jgi:hypothetical protein
MTSDPFLLTIFGAILGAILSPIISSSWTWIAFCLSQPNITGAYISMWERKSGFPNKQWIEVKINIYQGIGWYKFRSVDDKNYPYRGRFRLIDGVYLVGQWKSLRNQDESAGTFLLVRTRDGHCCYGVITAPNSDDLVECKKFILGRIDKKDNQMPDNSIVSKYASRGKKLLERFLGK